MIKKIILLPLAFCVSWGEFLPSSYAKELQILRNLDIESAYMSDVVFVEKKEYLKKIHSANLIHSTNRHYELVPVIRNIIKEEQLPDEFLYLAIVESGLRTHSISKAKAVGVWQFMENTAKSFSLQIDPYVDERRDFFKSTFAAAKYLQELKAEFGKWYLAILAYNCGNTKLRQAIKEAQSDELSILLDEEKKYLPLETRNFIKKILTLAFLAQNEDFHFEQEQNVANYPLISEFSKIAVPDSVSLNELAQLAELSYEEFKKYNPHFKYDFTPPRTQSFVYIPLHKALIFEKNIQEISLAKVDTTIPKTKIYIVKAGDTLYSIARKHRISIASIRAYNNIRKDHLSIKQKLILPIQEYEYAKNSQATLAHR